MPSQFENVIIILDKIGLTQVILPFLLVFTLVFAFLEKTKVLGIENGKPKTRFNAMVSFVIAFFVLVMVDVLKVINILVQYIVLIVVGVIMLAVILGILGAKKKANVVKAAALIIVLLSGLYALGLPEMFSMQSLGYIATPAIGVIAFILVIFYILRGKTSEAEIRPPEMQTRARPSEAQQRPRERAVRRPAIEEPFGEGPI